MKVIDNICKNRTLGSKKYAVVAVKKDVTYVLISHDLLKTQKTRKQHLRVTVELYDYATELYNELSRIGIIEQLSNVPQLGAIRVEHKLEKSRYDYVILQLYLHQLVQENLGKNLKFTYGSGIRLHEFGADESKLEGIGAISVADIVQVLTLAYNIGHFYNTFVSSRAVIMMANANETFRQLLYNGSTDERFSQVLETYLADKNYLRFHLLNSLLVLDKCNPDLYSVKLAREILYRANITLRQYQRLESGERNILTSSFGLACRIIEALDMDVSKFYHGDYYLEEEMKTTRGKGFSSRKKLSI